MTEFTAGLPSSEDPTGITAGPDGNLWFTEAANPGRIGRITPAGVITQFTAGLSPNAEPTGITAGADGNLWFTEAANPGRIGRITPAGVITQFTAGLSADAQPTGITAGPDGNLWFTEAANPGRIGRITPAGVITEFTAGLSPNAQPTGITAGADGNLWFTEAANPGRIGRITPAGVITEFTAGLSADAQPTGITRGPDGAIWFTEYSDPGRVGRITVGPVVGATSAGSVGPTTATITSSIAANGEATTYRVQWGPTSAYGQQTPDSPAGNGAALVSRTAALTGLTPSTTYHYRVVASNATATIPGPDLVFTTTSAPVFPVAPPLLTPPPVPVLGKAVAAAAVSGVVKVRIAGSTGYALLDPSEPLPVGSSIDTRKGRVAITSALPRGGKQTANFWSGVFTVRQARAGSGMTKLILARPTPCVRAPVPGASSENAKRRRPSLWAKDGHGRYQTHGANSVATVRGTLWQTVERCDGTLTRVRQGTVLVRDLRLHRTVRVTAGHSYLARSHR